MYRNSTKIFSLLSLVILTLFMLIGVDRHEYDPNTPKGHLKVYISDHGKQTTLISLQDNKFSSYTLRPDIRYRIYLEQDEDIFEDTFLCIRSDEEISVTGMDKSKEILYPLASYNYIYVQSCTETNIDISIVTYNKKVSKQVLYINDIQYIKDLDKYITDDTRDISIVFTEDMASDKLVISRPCELFTNGFTISLDSFITDYQSDKPFTLHLTNINQIKAKEFYVNTPCSDVMIEPVFFDEDPDYCINARSFNGSDVGKEIDINDPIKLLRLFDENYYPKLNPGTALNIYDITLNKEKTEEFYGYIKNSIYITEAVKLNILGNFELKDIRLILETYEQGEIRINIDSKGKFEYNNLEINAPLCSLVWVNDPPKEQFIAKYMNIKEYQGKNLDSYSLGGIGKSRILSFSSTSGVELEWYIRGNTIETVIPYSVSDSDLKQVNVSFDTDKGTGVIEEKYLKDGKVNLNEKPRIITTDEDGNTRVYMLSVVREKFDLPVIYIYTEENKPIDSKDEYIRAAFSMDADHINGSYSVNSTEINIRGRGNSTWKLFDKKPYRIKFDTKVSIMGLPANRDWVLLSNYADQSLIRNYIATEMGKTLGNLKFTPSSYPVDVFVNGEYMGVYTIGEQVEVAKSRVDIDEDYDDPDTGYLLEVGGTDNILQLGRDFFHCNLLKWVAIKSPDTLVMSKEHYDFIYGYTRAADNAIMQKSNYEDYIDIGSLIDWVILHEFTCNFDSGFRRSCFLYKEKGGKLFMGPVWDFDLAFGNYFRDYSYDSWFTCGGEVLGTTWTSYLYTDPAFCAQLKARWNAIKQDLKDTGVNSILEGSKMVYKSQKYNFAKWNKLLGNKTSLQPDHIRDLKTYDDHIEFLLEFIQIRYTWLDNAINNLP